MTNESLAAPGPAIGFRGVGIASAPVTRTWARLSGATVVGAVACVAAVLVCIGAQAPWFSISLFSVSADIGGLNSHLDGRYALALGGVGFALGTLVAVMPRGVIAHRLAAAAMALLGAGGVYLVWHQYVHLSNSATTLGRTSGLTPFAKYFDVHAGAAWGLWLTGGSFALFVVTAIASLLVNRR